ncbi:MAG TPA: M20/M25/M40 family metallo-hydrolase [Polyangia bacterium]|jgi:hypothetical protein
MPTRVALLLILLSACSAPAPAGPSDGGLDADVVPWVIDPQRIYDDVVRLSADDVEGRTPGTDGGELALTYVEGVFRELGLAPAGSDGYRQPFTATGWRLRTRPELTLGATPLRYPAEFGVTGGSAAGQVDAELVFVGFGVTVPPFDAAAYPGCPFSPDGYDDYAAVEVPGKVAVRLGGLHSEDEVALLNACPGVAYGYENRHGAAALLEVPNLRQRAWTPQAPIAADYAYPTHYLTTSRDALTQVIPALDELERALTATLAPRSFATGVTARVQVTASFTPVTTANVLAVVPGSSPTLAAETIVVGAHLDAVGLAFPGADDNASGTAVVLELARAVVGTGLVPARSLVLAVFNAEETGHQGSHAYCAQPVRPLAETAVMFSVDMVGAGDGSGLHLHPSYVSPPIDWVLAVLQNAAVADGLPYQVTQEPFIDASDHACFAFAGIPAMLVNTPGAHAGYHSPADRADHVTPEDLGAAARVLWTGLAPLARGEVAIPPPPR